MEGVYHVQFENGWETESLDEATPEKFNYEIGEQFRGVSFWLGRCSDANQPEGLEEAA